MYSFKTIKITRKRVVNATRKISSIASNCKNPTRLIQMFFVIAKSIIDYGSGIHPNIKSSTMRKKLATLIRVNLKRMMRLKQNTPNKVLYEIIGDPECEWKRRNMELENDRESLKMNLEYQDLHKKIRER